MLTSVRAGLERRGQPVPPSVTDVLDTPVRRSRVALAEVELGAGRADVARGMLEAVLPELEEEGRIRELIDVQFLLAAASLAAGDAAGAGDVAREALARAQLCGYAAITWKLRVVLSLAAQATGDAATATEHRSGATAEFRVLRDRITDPTLRDQFEQQQLAPNGPVT
jgi:hypothetical protein